MLLDKIVLGHSTESVAYAFVNDCYHVQTCKLQPLFFEEYDNFSLYGTKNKKQIWRRLKTYNGLIAKNLDYEGVESIRIRGDNIKIFSTGLEDEYTFGECYIFDTANISHENEVLVLRDETYKVVDDFMISRTSKGLTSVPKIVTGDALLTESYFYNSRRVDGSRHATDAVTVSTITKPQLHNFDFSDTMVTFKLRKLLEISGFQGQLEKGRRKDGKKIYKKTNISHVSRYVFPIDNNTYKDSRHVSFPRKTIQDIFSENCP